MESNLNYDKNKERKELQILIGDNLNRLSSLQGLDLQTYQTTILPKLLQIIINAKEKISQQYLLECIIQAFPDEYNIPSMKLILDTVFQLDKMIDSKTLLVDIMEKIAKFALSIESNPQLNTPEMKQNFQEILKLLIEKIDNLMKETSSLVVKEENQMANVLKLEVGLMKYVMKCCSKEEKLNTGNHIITEVAKLLQTVSEKIASKKIIKLIENLLTSSLQSDLSIFDFTDFAVLMKYLDFNSRNALAIQLTETLTKSNCNEKLDTIPELIFKKEYYKIF